MKYIFRILAFIFCGLFAALCVFPILFVSLSSFKGTAELAGEIGSVLGINGGYVTWYGLPLYPTLKSYVELLLDTPEFFVLFWNSVSITFFSLAGWLLIAVPAAWAFARFKIPGRKILLTLYIILMLMPFQVTMLSSYLVLDRLHLLNCHLGIILPNIFSAFPVFIMYRFFQEIPDALIEAAKLDGAGEWQIFVKVGIPLGSPGIISTLILGFLDIWNMIEQPMTFLKDKSLWPLSLYLPEIRPDNAGAAFCSSVITLIPAILIFLWGQDFLEKGIVASAIKE